jgi:hypothetical protein
MSEFDRFVKAHRTDASRPPRPPAVSLTGALPVLYVRLGFGGACVLLVAVGMLVPALGGLVALPFPLVLLWGVLEVLGARDRMRAFAWSLIVGGLALVILAVIFTAQDNRAARAAAFNNALEGARGSSRAEESSALPGVLVGLGMAGLGVLVLAIRKPQAR